MQKGTLSVQTENILPIIKRYLYSDQEIFLRELVSNAVDATQKLKTLANRGDFKGELGHLSIDIILDAEAKTLCIRDKGIGMSQEEVERYITQIAFSSAQEFLNKYENATAVIGHFGLGFYSAFMVADKVEIVTRSYKEGEEAVHWISDGGTTYEIGAADKEERGTDIILHLNAEEYTRDARIEELLNKYCRFLPVPIVFGETEEETELTDENDQKITISRPKVVNGEVPLWSKSPSELTNEDYLGFYRYLYPMQEDPLFWIHLNVDHPFTLTGILYFPKLFNSFEVRRDRIHLYSNRVFVTDHVENIVPEYLMLLHGIIDSPDIPLNVSRSYLQSDPEVKKINKHITRKVADKLSEIFRTQREEYEQKWEHIGTIVKYGMLTDEAFYEKATQFCLLTDNAGKQFTLDEYYEAVKEAQTDKHQKTIYLYASDLVGQHSFVQNALEKGYSVLNMGGPLDSHFINHWEYKAGNVQFKRVDSDTLNRLIEKDEEVQSVLSERETAAMNELFGKVVASPTVSVSVQALTPGDAPVQVIRPEWMRRMKDMAKFSGNENDFWRNAPETYQVTVNANHPLIASLAGNSQQEEAQQEKFAKQLYDLALLQQNMLNGADLTAFIQRSFDIMK